MDTERCRICGEYTKKAGIYYCKYCYENEHQLIKEMEFNIANIKSSEIKKLNIQKPKPKLYKFIFTYTENDNNLDELKIKEITTGDCSNALRLFHKTVKHHINYMITNIAITKI